MWFYLILTEQTLCIILDCLECCFELIVFCPFAAGRIFLCALILLGVFGDELLVPGNIFFKGVLASIETGIQKIEVMTRAQIGASAGRQLLCSRYNLCANKKSKKKKISYHNDPKRMLRAG